jgi:hypothetical protein
MKDEQILQDQTRCAYSNADYKAGGPVSTWQFNTLLDAYAAALAAKDAEIARLRSRLQELDGIVAKLPKTADVARAKAIIQSSIDSHVSWAAYRRKQGKDNPEYGDLEHHETCLREYAEVMVTLDSVAASTRQAAERASQHEQQALIGEQGEK